MLMMLDIVEIDKVELIWDRLLTNGCVDYKIVLGCGCK
jgi:hypothetical protein